MNGRKKLPAYVLRGKDGRSVPWPVDPSKRQRQAIEREFGVSGKRARKLMKAAKRRAKAEGLPPRPVPPHTPGRPVLPHRSGGGIP